MTETPTAPGGRFIIDVRVFMLSMTVAMCASFFAGVTMGPNPDAITNVILAKSPPPPLDLSPEVVAQSLEHAPAGQHLLVDIANVEAAFLDSEERLADAMVRTVDEAGLTMLSYHCHKLMPAGISCVGVLMESHISFHTWPEEGVITLDLFTCGPNPLLPAAVETMERLFGIQRSADEEVRVKWSHELRGFRPDDYSKSNNNVVDSYSDLSYMVHSPLDVYSKEQVYSNLTAFHRVDIWDVVELDDSPSHADGIKHGLEAGDPRWETPELTSPERSVFLNGYLIRGLHNDREVHEALVHPSMFAHPNPQHVAIIGGREGGALREVLKHKTVESALLVEQDEELVKISRKYFPEMSDCSDLVGRANDCFEDDHVAVSHADPQDYFVKNYGTPTGAGKLDVLIVDEKHPRHFPEFYTNQEFISSLVKSLSPEGVMVINAGMAPDVDDPRADKGVYHVREQLMRQLESHPDVGAMLVYEESRVAFNDPCAFLVVCRSASCRSRWYARSDQVDFSIYERIVRTNSKERALSYYDGTSQFSYSLPPKAWETVYCRREPTPFECAYLHLDPKKELHDLNVEDASKSSFRLESKESNVEGVEDETFVYATVDIPAGSYIMPKHLASSMVVTKRNLEGLENSLDVGGGPVAVIEDLLEFIGEHGHASHTEGSAVHYVEIGGSVLIRRVGTQEEANVGRWVPPHPSGRPPVFSPVYERHRMSFDVFIVATKDIPAGTELLRYKGLWEDN
ncbi:Polyamine aminopropyltransferase [Seminavis robusta]|uniref:Polyamine aminopropyltransferase n=1 Tax=Seminavis robusta TaxID=568900 RepID=A0A9N8ELL8_9STRA|nr:Polyamine aminopropyltransferase [Seminavis robusta]|eukprot:Sro1358_g265870.1 Polyamine aminopropyltransferase (740) ;mRNA; f:9407-11742